MTTATATGTLEQIIEIQEECKNYMEKYREGMARIRDLADQDAGAYQLGQSLPSPASSPSVRTSSEPEPKPRRGRPAGSKNKTPAEKKTPKTPKSDSPVASTGRNYDNGVSLRLVIWDVLDRIDDWGKNVEGLENDADALTVGQIKEMIESEAKWTSASANISSQIQQHVGKFRDAELLGRTTDRGYYIGKGAMLPEKDQKKLDDWRASS